MHALSDVGKMVGQLIRPGVEFGEDVATCGRDHIRAFGNSVARRACQFERDTAMTGHKDTAVNGRKTLSLADFHA